MYSIIEMLSLKLSPFRGAFQAPQLWKMDVKSRREINYVSNVEAESPCYFYGDYENDKSDDDYYCYACDDDEEDDDDEDEDNVYIVKIIIS